MVYKNISKIMYFLMNHYVNGGSKHDATGQNRYDQ